MALELWYSPVTGLRRKGTTFPELHDVFIENITTKFIFEPLGCCEGSASTLFVNSQIKEKDFDVLGVREQNEIIGYVHKNTVDAGDGRLNVQQFQTGSIIADSTPISELPELLTKNGYVFVLTSNKISGIVTKADINKPIVRLYLFGIISLFELHLNYWINRHQRDEGWTSLISQSRLQKANELFENRQGKNIELTKLECLQLCDKRVILEKTEDFLTTFDYSRRFFERFLKDVEIIRNEIAHSQISIIDNVSWDTFVFTTKQIRKFLTKSEDLVVH